MIACWSPKGGSGTSVISALLALSIARTGTDTVLADLQGDQLAILGLDVQPELGLREWLRAGDGVGLDTIVRLAVPVVEHLNLLPSGQADLTDESQSAYAQSVRLIAALSGRTSIVDVGRIDAGDDFSRSLVENADTSLLVIRPCYLAAKRAESLAIKTTGLVVIEEPDRVLSARDMEDALQVPVVMTMKWDASVARAVDAGRLLSRRYKLPKPIESLRDVS